MVNCARTTVTSFTPRAPTPLAGRPPTDAGPPPPGLRCPSGPPGGLRAAEAERDRGRDRGRRRGEAERGAAAPSPSPSPGRRLREPCGALRSGPGGCPAADSSPAARCMAQLWRWWTRRRLCSASLKVSGAPGWWVPAGLASSGPRGAAPGLAALRSPPAAPRGPGLLAATSGQGSRLLLPPSARLGAEFLPRRVPRDGVPVESFSGDVARLRRPSGGWQGTLPHPSAGVRRALPSARSPDPITERSLLHQSANWRQPSPKPGVEK